MITGLFRELFPYIVLLYLADCIGYARGNCAIFTSLSGREYAARGPGFHLKGLLPDSIAFVATKKLPLLAPSGVFFPGAAAGERLYLENDFEFVAYEEMKDIHSEECSLYIMGDNVATFCSPAMAEKSAGFFSNLAGTDLSAREGEIEKFRRVQCSRAALQEKKDVVDSRIESVKLLSWSFCMVVFLIVPLAVYTPLAYRVNGKLLLGTMLLLYLLIAAFTLKGAGTLSQYGPVKKLSTVLTVVLYPISALHAAHLLTHYLYGDHEYMTLASVFLSPRGFRGLLRPEFHRINCSLEKKIGPEFRDCLLGMKTELEGLAAEAGLSHEEITAPPKRQDPAAGCYCPVCEAEYVSESTECVDCYAPLQNYPGKPAEVADGSSS